MAKQLMPMPKQAFTVTSGGTFQAFAGGKVYTYASGTTTPLATYTDSNGNTANANPVVLDSRGEASIWLTPGVAYRIKLTTSAGAEVWTQDGVTTGGGSSGAINAVDHYGATGDGTTDDTTALQNAINAAIAAGRSLYIPAGVYKFTQLTIAVSATGLGPLYIYGDGSPYPQFNGNRGTLLRQIDGTTGTAITYTGNWSGSKFLLSMGIRGIGLYLSNALTGWGIDMFNVNGFASEFSDIGIYAPASTTAGLWRQRSCWQITMRNIRGDGPSSGSTTKGLVIYGDNATGTTNQTLIENINFVGCPKCNVQIGKWDESGGGTTQSIVWNSGQAGTASGYGVVIGRAFDVTITGVHTENHDKSGWLITESANGADSGYIKLINCDSYGDGVGGTGTADADTYTIQVKRTNILHIDGFRMQEATCGIWVDDTTQATNIEIDRVSFGGKSNNTDSETIIYLANTTPSTTKRVLVGHYNVAYTWGNNGANIIENGDCLSYKRRTDGDSASTSSAGTEEIYPWTEELTLLPTYYGIGGTANNGAGRIRVLTNNNPSGITTGDTVRVWSVLGTVEANGVWTATVDSVATTGTTSNGSAVITGIPSTAGLSAGMAAFGSNIPSGRAIASVDSATQVTLDSGTSVTAGTAAITFVSLVLDGSTYTNAFANSSNEGIGKIRSLTDLVAFTNYEIALDQKVTVNCRAGNIKFVDVANGGNFYLKDGRDWICEYGDAITFVRRGTNWFEVSRASNRVDIRRNNGGLDFTNTVREYGTATSISITNQTNVVFLAHSGATNLNTLADTTGQEATQGQVVRLVATNGNTTCKDASGGGSAKFRLAGGADLTLGNRDTLTVMKVGTEWYELSRSNN